MSLQDEIAEQPQILAALLENSWAKVETIASQLRERDFDFVYVIARGSSDNAGLYAKYLFGIENKLVVAMASPSLFTKYDSPPRLARALVLAISQSGSSVDLVEALREARRQGAVTLAFCNVADSPLAREAEFFLDLEAGPELAVAATKSYTAQLMAISMLSTALAQDRKRQLQLKLVAPAVADALKVSKSIPAQAQRYRYMRQGVVLGRGYNFSTAHEWSLKMKEMTYVVAAPYSSADFRHGPIAIVDRGFPVFAVVNQGVSTHAS
ncbi:MAG: SIS domain-containing protein [Planctomycetota bacterium]